MAQAEDDINIYKKSNNNFFISSFTDDFKPISQEEQNLITKENVRESLEYIKQFIDLKEPNKKNNIRDVLQNTENDLNKLINFIENIKNRNIIFKQIKETSKENDKFKFINFYKKREIFKNSKINFVNSLIKCKIKTKKTKLIFEELNYFKNLGFYLNDDIIKKLDDENIEFYLKNKYILNFQEIINLNKHFFILNYNEKEENKFQLKSNFFDDFTEKYKIIFEFKLYYDNKLQLDINGYNMNINLIEFIEEYYKNDKIKYNIKSYLIFYHQYLLYKFFRYEIIQILKNLKNLNKDNTFALNGFQYKIIQNGYITSVNVNFYNLFRIIFTTKKISVENFNKIEKKQVHGLESHLWKLCTVFFRNILYDCKIGKNIKIFIVNTKNLILDDLFNYGIIIKNLNKFLFIILNYISNISYKGITDEKNLQNYPKLYTYNIIKYNQINLIKNELNYNFILTKKNFLNFNNDCKTYVFLKLTKNGKIQISIKKQSLINFYMTDNENYEIKEFDRAEPNFIIDYIENSLY